MSYRSSADASYPRVSSSSIGSGSGSRSSGGAYGSSSSGSSWASPSRGSSGGGVGAYSAAYDDARRYAPSHAGAYGHGSHHHSTLPSPATSSTSTASSLRTPPDLLLNGTAMATAWKSASSVHSLEKQPPPPPAFLSIAEIEKRIKLLSTLPSELMSDALPSPPSSPRPSAARKKATRVEEPAARQGSTSRERERERPEERRSNGSTSSAATSSRSSLKAPTSAGSSSAAARKRKSDVARVDYSDDDSETDAPAKSRAAPPDKRPRTASSASSSAREKREDDAAATRGSSNGAGNRSREASSSAVRLDAPEPREWSKERFLEVAARYRTHGRELKHRGDQRLREASAQQLSSGQPSSAAQLAALEQTDALLLYVYGFWCEDQAATSSAVPHACVAHNWASLFGLLKYVHACHERNGNKVLAGLCRLLEAVVLRRLSEHEQRLLSHRLQKLAALAASGASSTGHASASGSPSGANVEVTAPSPASAHSTDTNGAVPSPDIVSALADAARSMSKSVSDSERSNKLFAQARVALSASVLEAQYPEVSAASGAAGNIEAWRDASRLDPSAIGLTAKEDKPQARWAWPLEHVTPLPHFVTFGRALLRETATTARLSFRPARVPPPSPAPTSRS